MFPCLHPVHGDGLFCCTAIRYLKLYNYYYIKWQVNGVSALILRKKSEEKNSLFLTNK